MLGSLKEFIEIDLPPINSRNTTEQNEQDHTSTIDNHFKRQLKSNHEQYQPSDKSQLLTKFNLKSNQHHLTNRHNKTLNPNSNKTFRTRSQVNRKHLCEHTSFFTKSEITKDYIAKSQLKRKHNLLRAIIRTNQNQNQNEGVSDYDQSFKRMYDKFKSIYAKPILQFNNLDISEDDHQLPTHTSMQVHLKPSSSLNNRKRIQYENCLSWARKHKKKGDFYAQQLGKQSKISKNQSINMGHSLMSQVQKKIKSLSQKD